MDAYGDWSSNPPLPPLEDVLQMDLVAELNDAQFEPQTRARSNTWPCPPRGETFTEQLNDNDSESNKASTQNLPTGKSFNLISLFNYSNICAQFL